jgi:hypothetical protein
MSLFMRIGRVRGLADRGFILKRAFDSTDEGKDYGKDKGRRTSSLIFALIFTLISIRSGDIRVHPGGASSADRFVNADGHGRSFWQFNCRL